MSSSLVLSSVRNLRRILAEKCGQEQSDEQLLSAFVEQHDDSAFAALVRRHGPMVLGVCRRVLGHEQDAEDAFQATFLVLAQRAAALRDRAALASFLHGTAFRLASKAKRAAGRRRKYEGQAPPHSSVNPSDDLLWREVRSMLDEEIARLPESFRRVFVLCYLENLSQAEAGRRLGLKERTISNRLAAARQRLQRCLLHRCPDLSAVLAIIAVATPSASALPTVLLASTTKAALTISLGQATPAAIPAPVAELLQSAAPAMFVSKAKIASAVLLVLGVLAGAGWWRTAGGNPLVSAPSAGSRSPLAAPQKKSDSVAVNGSVIDPAGKPVRGAKLVLVYYSPNETLHKVWATSDGDGRFQFAAPRELVGNSRSHLHIIAEADGFGFAMARLDKGGAADLTLRLVKDDVPIRGRILDLQGRPVAGARVRIADSLYTAEKGDLSAWLAALQDPKQNGNIWSAHLTYLYSPAFTQLIPPVTTGADGRFCIRGIGRERVAELRVEGPTIATQAIHAMTRRQEAIHLPNHPDYPKRRILHYYGTDFDLVAMPTRPVMGVVRDKDTGKPLAGVKIQSELVVSLGKSDFLRTVTDSEGRYRLVGLPKGDGFKIVATTSDFPRPPKSDLTKQPAYPSAIRTVGNPPGIEPVAVDFALKRGAWIKGRITDKSTGKAVEAQIEYFGFTDNPNAKELSFDLRLYLHRWTGEDGSFLIPALPGRGLIAVRAGHDHYIMGAGAEHIQAYRNPNQSVEFSTVPYICYAENFHSLIEINPKPGDEAITCNFALDPGRSLKGMVHGLDGKPLAGARISGLTPIGDWKDAGAEFTAKSLQLNKPRVLEFMHKSKKLAGVLVLRGDETKPISVRLEPWGAVTGRLVSPRGEPLAGLEVNCRMKVIRNGKTLDTTTLLTQSDKDGRFRIEGLAAGRKYDDFSVIKGVYLLEIVGGGPKKLTLKAGETKDLGTLTVKPLE